MRTAVNRIVVTVLLLGAATLGNAANSYELNIPAQPLAKALQSFAQQSGLSLVHYSKLIDVRLAPALEGSYTPDAALKKLLENTDLEYAYVNENTIEIRQAKSAREASGKTSAVVLGERYGLHLAQSDSAAGQGLQEKENAVDPTENSQGGRLEEVVVTAQKRKERLQDVPISISVLSGEALDSSTRQGAWDALAKVPGVAVFDGGNFDIASLNVRGVTTRALGAGSTPVGYYLDAVPFSFVKSALVPDLGVYDLERIEVLRGPQGTLYGVNALNGVVRVLTKSADLDEFGFKARTSVASTKDGDESYRADVALNVPLIEGKLAVRAVVGYQNLGGWIDTPIERNANDNTLKNLRLKVNAAPTEKLSIGLSGWWSQTHADSTNSSTDDYARVNRFPEPQENEFDAYSVEIGYDFGFAQLTSRSSRLTFDMSSLLDFVDFCSFNCPLFGSRFPNKLYAQEITLNSTGEGVWSWTLGGMYRDAEDRLAQGFISGPPSADFTNASESTAVFGELTRAFMDGRWELTGGLRYFRDEVSLDENVRSNPAGPADLMSSNRTFDKVTPRVVLTWHPRESSTVYASYAQGFRSGLEQDPIVTRLVGPGVLPSTQPDTLTNYELGAKSMFMGGLLDVEAAVFYIDWTDVQQTIGVAFTDSQGRNNVTTALLNGGSASGLGAETVITWRPVPGLSLSGNYSWNDLEFDSSPATSFFLKGDRINESPKYTAGGSIDYAFSLGASGARGHVSTSAAYRGEYLTKQGRTTSFPAGSRLIARAEAGVELSRSWEINAYVDNLADNYAGIENQFGIQSWVARPRPRTYGLQLEYKFQ
jgi:iron complex outermembrane recepter protein